MLQIRLSKCQNLCGHKIWRYIFLWKKYKIYDKIKTFDKTSKFSKNMYNENVDK